MATTLATKCCNVSYDLLTIFISIADVTTDIIILVGFYEKERMTFFAISLAILILAQCSYSIAFAIRFGTIDAWNPCCAFIAFCCCLPFGSFVAFCMYLVSEEAGFDCFRDFVDHDLGLDTYGFFTASSSDSKMVQWIKKKLDRHLGFILEAVVEAFPQSLLQIVAIVYYQEANYISIISILLSMFSVMTKSLMLSQGIEKATFVFTWLCVVTDFFGIFFTLTWVFYSHDSIDGDFLGYFNIFGEIWLWKFAISTLLPVSLSLIIFFLCVYWVFFFALMCDPEFSRDPFKRCGYSWLWFIFTPILAILYVFAACLGCEVFCFSIVALGIYTFGTDRIGSYQTNHVTKVVSMMIDFLSKGNRKDRVIRILSINYSLNKIQDTKCLALRQFIDKTLEEGQYKSLQKVTYQDIRHNCTDPNVADLFGDLIDEIKTEYTDSKRRIQYEDGMGKFIECNKHIIYVAIFFVFGPILLISKLVQILYPWIIVCYLIYYNLIFTNQIDIYQLVMLAVYIGLQLILLFLGIYVFRIHWWLWHIQPGTNYTYWGYGAIKNIETYRKEINNFYDNVCWFPQVDIIVMNRFGNDIGNIIMDYCRHFQLDETALP